MKNDKKRGYFFSKNTLRGINFRRNYKYEKDLKILDKKSYKLIKELKANDIKINNILYKINIVEQYKTSPAKEIHLKNFDGWRIYIKPVPSAKKSDKIYRAFLFHPSLELNRDADTELLFSVLAGDRSFNLSNHGIKNLVKTLKNKVEANFDKARAANYLVLPFDDSTRLTPEYVNRVIENRKKEKRKYQNLVNDIDDLFRHRILNGANRFFKYIESVHVYNTRYYNQYGRLFKSIPEYKVFFILNDMSVEKDIMNFLKNGIFTNMYENIIRYYGYTAEPDILDISSYEFAQDSYCYKKWNISECCKDSLFLQRRIRFVSVYNADNNFKGNDTTDNI